MVDPKSVSSVASSALELAESSASAPVDDKAVDAFEQAFADTGDSSSSNNIGQGLVEKAGELRESYNSKVEAINESMMNVTSPAELLKLNWQISSLTLQQDLLAKTAGKSNQNLETLLKMQ